MGARGALVMTTCRGLEKKKKACGCQGCSADSCPPIDPVGRLGRNHNHNRNRTHHRDRNRNGGGKGQAARTDTRALGGKRPDPCGLSNDTIHPQTSTCGQRWAPQTIRPPREGRGIEIEMPEPRPSSSALITVSSPLLRVPRPVRVHSAMAPNACKDASNVRPLVSSAQVIHRARRGRLGMPEIGPYDVDRDGSVAESKW